MKTRNEGGVGCGVCVCGFGKGVVVREREQDGRGGGASKFGSEPKIWRPAAHSWIDATTMRSASRRAWEQLQGQLRP